MAGIEIYACFGPDPASEVAEAQTALVAYLALAAVAALVDWARGTSITPLAPTH
jgi:hypothetical protein